MSENPYSSRKKRNISRPFPFPEYIYHYSIVVNYKVLPTKHVHVVVVKKEKKVKKSEEKKRNKTVFSYTLSQPSPQLERTIPILPETT